MGRPSPTPPPPTREPGPCSAEPLGAACLGLMLPCTCVAEASPSPVGLSACRPRAPAGALGKSRVHSLLPSLQTVHLGPNPGSATTRPAPPEAGFLPGEVDVVTHRERGRPAQLCSQRTAGPPQMYGPHRPDSMEDSSELPTPVPGTPVPTPGVAWAGQRSRRLPPQTDCSVPWGQTEGS